MIEGLHEILIPEPVSFLPQTIGWLIVAILLLSLAAWIGYRWRRYRQANRYRSLALLRISQIEAELAGPARVSALASIPRLVKRVALEAYPREEVASLSGNAWLEFLDESYGGKDFTEGSGRLLPVLSYVTPEYLEVIREKEISGLTRLVKVWIKKHS
jgi:hypothetical protein